MSTDKTANDAPVKLARTSKTSACLVVVNLSCSNSIVIPNKNENKNESNKGFKSYLNFNCFLKNKNQTKVKTK